MSWFNKKKKQTMSSATSGLPPKEVHLISPDEARRIVKQVELEEALNRVKHEANTQLERRNTISNAIRWAAKRGANQIIAWKNESAYECWMAPGDDDWLRSNGYTVSEDMIERNYDSSPFKCPGYIISW